MGVEIKSRDKPIQLIILLHLFVVLLLFQHSVFSALRLENKGSFFVKNYTPQEYKASAINWAIIQDHRGVMYFGNDNGLLEFDGVFWKLLRLPNNSRVRSLANDDSGVIYVGAVAEFGYLAADENKKLTYVSLIPFIPEKMKEFNDVWSVHVTSHGVYFCTLNTIYRYYQNKILVIPSEYYLFSAVINDMVIFKGEDNLMAIDHGKLISLPGTEKIFQERSRIHIWTLNEHQILLMLDSGFWTYNLSEALRSAENFTKPLLNKIPSEFDTIFPNFNLYSGVRINDHFFAVSGLNNKGLFIFDSNGNMERSITAVDGLPDESVYWMYVDHSHNLWLALSNGISYVHLSSPVTMIGKEHGIHPNCKTILPNQDGLYVVTMDGVFFSDKSEYFYPEKKGCFKRVTDTLASYTILKDFAGHVIAGGINGVFCIDKDQSRSILKDYPLCAGISRRFPDCLFLGGHYGLFCIKAIGKNPDMNKQEFEKISSENFKIQSTINRIYEDIDGNLWLASEKANLIKIVFNSDHILDFKVLTFDIKNIIPEAEVSTIFSIDQELYISTGKSIYRAKRQGITNYTFFPYHGFSDDPFVNERLIFQAVKDTQNQIWMWTDEGIVFVGTNRVGKKYFEMRPFAIPIPKIKELLIEDPGLLWIPTINGLYCFDNTIKKDYEQSYTVLLREVTGRDSMLYGGGQPADLGRYPQVKLKYADNSLEFKYAAAFYEYADSNTFSVMLKGFDRQWSQWSEKNDKTYNNLSEGSYVFQIRGKNIYSQISQAVNFPFIVLPPWYRTIYAYLGYLFLLLLTFYSTFRFNQRRLWRANQRLEKLVKERTHELVQSNREISRQRDEISVKKKEIETYAGELVKAKDALWGEMELAKKIQSALLPKEPQIPGYEMSAYMRPADEVGGDYYDVICINNNDRRGGACLHPDSKRAGEKDGEPCRGGSRARPLDSGQFPKTNPTDHSNPRFGFDKKGSSENEAYDYMPLQDLSSISNPGQPQGFAPTDLPTTNHHPPSTDLEPSHWLSIGDVSGHGVSAGLVMMMVQTAIRQALDKNPTVSPKTILESVNRVIHENIRKLGEDKYMTITLFCLQPEGKIVYSGLHQDVMLYRAATREVEIMETRGIWIGMTDDINGMIAEDSIQLASGDTMLLYTDGITESSLQNGQMYSDQKLQQVFSALGNSPIKEIIPGILASLADYQCDDDITMVVLRRTD